MLYELCCLGLLAVAFGQGVQEKGNLDQLISDVFDKKEEGRADAGSEKVRKTNNNFTLRNKSRCRSSHATEAMASASLTISASTERSTLTDQIYLTFDLVKVKSVLTTLSNAVQLVVRVHFNLQ